MHTLQNSKQGVPCRVFSKLTRVFNTREGDQSLARQFCHWISQRVIGFHISSHGLLQFIAHSPSLRVLVLCNHQQSKNLTSMLNLDLVLKAANQNPSIEKISIADQDENKFVIASSVWIPFLWLPRHVWSCWRWRMSCDVWYPRHVKPDWFSHHTHYHCTKALNGHACGDGKGSQSCSGLWFLTKLELHQCTQTLKDLDWLVGLPKNSGCQLRDLALFSADTFDVGVVGPVCILKALERNQSRFEPLCLPDVSIPSYLFGRRKKAWGESRIWRKWRFEQLRDLPMSHWSMKCTRIGAFRRCESGEYGSSCMITGTIRNRKCQSS